MSQFDYGTIDPNSKSGAQLALDLNSFRDALNSLHRGDVRPVYAQPGMLWVKETSTSQWDLMWFDGDTDFSLRTVNPSTNEVSKFPQSQIEGLENLPSIYVGKDSNTGAAVLPSGTTAERPASPSAGMFRYNSTTGRHERRSATAWLDYGQMDGPLNEASLSTIVSAAAIDIGSLNNTITVTGTATITSLGTVAAGIIRRMIFTGISTLTHNSTSLILPGSADIITAAGDVAEVVSLGSGNWRCLYYSKASGSPVSSSTPVTYTSEYALTAGALYPITHSYGINASVEFIYVCKVANAGYSVGGEVELKDFTSNPDTGARTSGAFLHSRTSSGFTIGLGNGAVWTFPAKGTGVATSITLASWAVKARIKP